MSTQTIKVGDVRMYEGGFWICYRWSDSCASVRPLQKRMHVIKPRGKEEHGGKEVKFVAPDVRVMHWSPNTPGPFVARLGENWMTKDFATEVPGFSGEANVPKPKAATKPHPLDVPAIVADLDATPTPKALKATKPAPEARPLPTKGKCGWLIEAMKLGALTRNEMVAQATEKFGGTLEQTGRTLSALPSQMRRNGIEPKFKEVA